MGALFFEAASFVIVLLRIETFCRSRIYLRSKFVMYEPALRHFVVNNECALIRVGLDVVARKRTPDSILARVRELAKGKVRQVGRS